MHSTQNSALCQFFDHLSVLCSQTRTTSIVKMSFHYVKEVNYDNLHTCVMSCQLDII